MDSTTVQSDAEVGGGRVEARVMKAEGPGADMDSTKKNARIAGWLYLICCLPAPFSLLYVPNTLIVSGNATETASRILAHETMFRLAMAGELISAIAFILAVRALYVLLQGVNKRHATLMVTLFAISIPISCLNVLNEVAALVLLKGADSPFGLHETPARRPGAGIPSNAQLWVRCRSDLLGSLAPPVRCPRLSVGLHSPHPGRLADHQRPGLSRDQFHGPAPAAIQGDRVSDHAPAPLRGSGNDAVAHRHGSERAKSGRLGRAGQRCGTVVLRHAHSLPANAVILAVVARAAPHGAVGLVEQDGVDGAAGFRNDLELVAHLRELGADVGGEARVDVHDAGL